LIFDQSKVKLISIEEEIEMLKNYLELEKLRFKGKVDVRLVIDEEVEANEQDYMVPPLLIQPIIENSFRHGLFHKGDGGILEVIFTLENNGLKCIVRDNGIGRAKSSEINKWRDRSHKSSGLSTTMDRVKILDNNQGKMKLIINDLVNNDGSPIGTETIIYF
jgi:LytS/YehU family sensor histidine kinase